MKIKNFERLAVLVDECNFTTVAESDENDEITISLPENIEPILAFSHNNPDTAWAVYSFCVPPQMEPHLAQIKKSFLLALADYLALRC